MATPQSAALQAEVFESEAKMAVVNWVSNMLYGALYAPEKKPLLPQLEEFVNNHMIGLRAEAEAKNIDFDVGKFEFEVRTILDLHGLRTSRV